MRAWNAASERLAHLLGATPPRVETGGFLMVFPAVALWLRWSMIAR